MREGEVGREMFVIVKGKVHVTKASCSLGLLPPGSFFGEMAIVQASVSLSAYRDRTAVSYTDCAPPAPWHCVCASRALRTSKTGCVYSTVVYSRFAPDSLPLPRQVSCAFWAAPARFR